MQDRIYQGDDGSWYYRARGNSDVGPYESYQDAEQRLNKQIRTWSKRARPRLLWRKSGWQESMMPRSAPRQT